MPSKIFATILFYSLVTIGCGSVSPASNPPKKSKSPETSPSGDKTSGKDAKVASDTPRTEDAEVAPSGSSASTPPSPEAKIVVPGTCASQDLALDVLGQTRHTTVYAPSETSGAAKLIILFHGNGDSRGNFCNSTRVCEHFKSQGYVVAVPDGRRRDVRVDFANQTMSGISWDAYNLNSTSNEDLALFDGIATALTTNCGTRSVYVLGHSQGGFLAAHLLMLRSDVLAGVGISEAGESIPGYRWQPKRQVPFAITIGTRDPSYASAQSFHDRLKNQGYQTQFTPLEGVGHGGFPAGAEKGIAEFFEGNP